MLTVISDRKLAHSSDGTTVDYFTSEILSTTDTYIGGAPMSGRTYNRDGYAYGHNGQEKDDEIFEGAYTAEYWEYDSRIIRRWNIDPIEYPWQSSYACFNNNPIYFADPDGLEGQDWVKNKITGVTEWDASVNSKADYDKKYGNDKDHSYVGDYAVNAVDKNGNIFNGRSDGVPRYRPGQKATTNVDGSYSAPVEKNSPGTATKVEVDEAAMNAELQRKWRNTYNWYTMASGRLDQSISPFDFWSPANFLKATPKVAKLSGRLGNLATRTQIDEIATVLERRGYEIVGGGGRFPEEYLPGINGGRKGSSFIDITARKDNMLIRINTVDIYKSGAATKRELINAARIRAQIGNGQHLLLIPKK